MLAENIVSHKVMLHRFVCMNLEGACSYCEFLLVGR